MTTTTRPKTKEEIRARLDEISGTFRRPVDLSIYHQLVAERETLIAEYRRLEAGGKP
jgi:hypothetical protein